VPCRLRRSASLSLAASSRLARPQGVCECRVYLAAAMAAAMVAMVAMAGCRAGGQVMGCSVGRCRTIPAHPSNSSSRLGGLGSATMRATKRAATKAPSRQPQTGWLTAMVKIAGALCPAAPRDPGCAVAGGRCAIQGRCQRSQRQRPARAGPSCALPTDGCRLAIQTRSTKKGCRRGRCLSCPRQPQQPAEANHLGASW
jgi:hypothetical protein